MNQLGQPGDYLPIFNVTVEPGCCNNWHIHHANAGGGQVLICVDGYGWHQEKGKPGDIVEIPANVKHWRGAAADSWSAISLSSAPARAAPTSGASPSTTQLITHWKSKGCSCFF